MKFILFHRREIEIQELIHSTIQLIWLRNYPKSFINYRLIIQFWCVWLMDRFRRSRTTCPCSRLRSARTPWRRLVPFRRCIRPVINSGVINSRLNEVDVANNIEIRNILMFYLVRDTPFVVVRKPFFVFVRVRHSGITVEYHRRTFQAGEFAHLSVRHETFLAYRAVSFG